jgi:hypothetical protein
MNSCMGNTKWCVMKAILFAVNIVINRIVVCMEFHDGKKSMRNILVNWSTIDLQWSQCKGWFCCPPLIHAGKICVDRVKPTYVIESVVFIFIIAIEVLLVWLEVSIYSAKNKKPIDWMSSSKMWGLQGMQQVAHIITSPFKNYNERTTLCWSCDRGLCGSYEVI